MEGRKSLVRRACATSEVGMFGDITEVAPFRLARTSNELLDEEKK